jgi:hypothetical protein
MTWGLELIKLRRYLRDPAGNIWSEELLRKLWAEIQSDLARRTRILEDMRTISIPPRIAWSHTYPWEQGYVTDDTSVYLAFHNQGGFFTATALWEAQEYAGLEADISDGGSQVSFPWEAWHAPSEAGRPIVFPFPHDYRATIAMYYDREPLPYRSKKEISSSDPSWQTRSGEPLAYYRDDEVSNHFSVWPRPSTATWIDIDGAGMVTFIDGESVTSEVGAIIHAQDYVTLADAGVAVDVVDADGAITLVMDLEPREPGSLGDKLSYPQYLTRYIRFGVLGRAYGANTDGRITSLGKFWTARYEVGIRDIKRFMSKRRQDRDYRFVTQNVPARSAPPRQPRLPDGYPAI